MVSIIGVGMTKHGWFPERNVIDLGVEAVEASLEDAGINISEIKLAFCGNCFSRLTPVGAMVLRELGRTGAPVIDVDQAGASGCAAFYLAYQAVNSGKYDCVLAFGTEQTGRGWFDPATLYTRWEVDFGLDVTPLWYAMLARRWMHDEGGTAEQIAKVSVKNHANGVLNPKAMYRKALTLEQVLNSPMVCDPLTLFEIAQPNDGAAAAILCSEEKADKLGRKPIRVLATVERFSKYPFTHVPSFCASPTGNPSVHAETAREAYEMAGIGPDALSLAEVQDTTSFSEIVLYEDLGLCKPGEGGSLVDEGVTELKGRLPVNTSGGFVSRGEAAGAAHLAQIYELVLQLRGEAGERQVRGAKIGLAHTWGNVGHCGITILTNRR